MSFDRYSSHDIEALLALDHEAGEAGVSNRTPIAVDDLVGQPVEERHGSRVARSAEFKFARFLRAAVPLAACLTIVVGLKQLESPSAIPLSNSSGYSPADSDCTGLDPVPWASLASFSACLSGPGQPIPSTDCICADLDQDGDVDLLDYGRYQLLAGSQAN